MLATQHPRLSQPSDWVTMVGKLFNARAVLYACRKSRQLDVVAWWHTDGDGLQQRQWVEQVAAHLDGHTGPEAVISELPISWIADLNEVSKVATVAVSGGRGQTGFLAVIEPRQTDDAVLIGLKLACSGLQATLEASVLRAVEASTRHRNQVMEGLRETTRLLAEEQEMEKVLQAIVRQARTLTETDLALLMLTDNNNQTVTVQYFEGAQKFNYTGFSLPVSEGIVGLAMRSRRAIASTRLLYDPRRNEDFDDHLNVEQIVSGLCAPMYFHNRLVGMLYVCTRTLRAFSADQAMMLQELASAAAIAVETARLVASQRQAVIESNRLHRLAEERAQMLARSMEIQQRLIQLVVTDHRIDDIVRSLAELLGLPVMVENVAGQSLGQAVGATGQAEPAWNEELLPVIGQRMGVRLALNEVQEHRRAVLLGPEGRASCRGSRIIVPIVVGGHLVGYLSVFGEDEAFDQSQVLIAEQAAVVVALEAAKQRVLAAVEARLGSELLTRLLSGQGVQDPTLLYRATYLGYDLNGTHVIMAVMPAEPPVEDDDPLAVSQMYVDREAALVAACRRALDTRRQKGIVAGHQGIALLLLSVEPGKVGAGLQQQTEDLFAAIGDQLRASGVNMTLWGGCSEPVSTVDRLPQAKRNAMAALDIGRRLDLRQQLQSYDRLGVLRLLAQVKEPFELVNFAYGVLGSLASYDEENGTELLATLDVYVRERESHKAAAAAANIHPNTLKYRLTRIEEISGLQLDNPEQMLDVHIALKIVNLFGLGPVLPTSERGRQPVWV